MAIVAHSTAKTARLSAAHDNARSPLGAMAALGGVAAYFALFLFWPIAEFGNESRIQMLFVALLRPDDYLLRWFEGASWPSLGERAWILFLVLAILSAATSAGWLWLRLLRVDRALTRLEMTLLSGIVGLNLASLAILLLGLAGLLRAELFIALGVGACVAAAATRWRLGCASGTCRVGPAFAHRESDVWNWNSAWLWLLAPFALAILGSAMLPPLDFDVREYHLQAPKEFYQAGRITFLPHNIYANMPLGTEMFALAGMVLCGDWWTGAMVGKTLIGLFAPLAALLLYAAGSRLASPAAGVVAALVYISVPWVAIVSTHCLVEGAFACYFIAAIYLTLIWRERLTASAATATPESLRGLLLTVGFLAGAAVSTKYPAVVYCAVPLACVVALIGYYAAGPRMLFKSAAWMVLGVAIGCGPWFAKNAALTGNPTYPLLYQVFGGETRTVDKEVQWQQAHRPPNFQPTDLARRAWDVTVAGAWLSPLIAPFAALAFAVRSQRRLVTLLAGLLLFIFAAWWLLTHRIDRFLVPIWPLAALLVGIGATWNASLIWRRALFAMLALGGLLNFVLVAGGPVADNRYLAPLDVLRAESVALVDPWHAWLNGHAADIQRVLLVGDAQPFDLETPAIYNTVFDDSIFEQLARGKSPSEVRRTLLERGVSHVYAAWPEIERYRSPGNYGITEFLQPAIFDTLVEARVLERLPMLAESRGEMFRVIAQ